MMKHVLVFDIRGPYGHFRKPYAPASPVTYPCPTPTSVYGMVGAICGFEKNEYLERINSGSVAVGIRLLKPVRKFRCGINLVNTKGNKDFRLHGPNPRIQIPFEFLRDPAFRIYFWHERRDIYEALRSQLKAGTTVYTPCLGLAQCVAEVHFAGEYEGRAPAEIQHSHALVHTVVPVAEETTLVYEDGKRYLRFTIPASMEPGRKVTRYQEAVVEESGREVTVRGAIPLRCGDDNVLFF